MKTFIIVILIIIMILLILFFKKKGCKNKPSDITPMSACCNAKTVIIKAMYDSDIEPTGLVCINCGNECYPKE